MVKSIPLHPAASVAAGFCLLVVATGCSEPKFYPVKGKATIFAVGPLTEGEVRFRPVSRPSLIASGKVQKDGSFTLSTPGHGEGVLEGDCQVEIALPEQSKSRLAERFTSFDTSDLRFTVAPREENYFFLDLKRTGK